MGVAIFMAVMSVAYTIFQIWAMADPGHTYKGRPVWAFLVALSLDALSLVGIASTVPVIPERIQRILGLVYTLGLFVSILSLLFASSPWYTSSDDWFEYFMLVFVIGTLIVTLNRLRAAKWF